MKYKIILLCLILIAQYNLSNAQDIKSINKKITVTTNKTTFLIFKSPVDYFDYGSPDIGVEQTDKKNILKVKAAKANFKETNLTVMTTDEQFYSIIVNYQEIPDTLNYILKVPVINTVTTNRDTVKNNSNNFVKTVQLPQPDVNIDYQYLSAQAIKLSKKQNFIAGSREGGVLVILKGIYINQEKLYFHFAFSNLSSIDYDMDFIKFSIKNKKRIDKSSVQETEVQPTFTMNNDLLLIKAMSKTEINQVFVFDKFTLPDSKKMILEIGERNGERNITTDINPGSILKAKRF
ncbi:MAG: conjugative transposon protein TraN [Daejeonella sp.]